MENLLSQAMEDMWSNVQSDIKTDETPEGLSFKNVADVNHLTFPGLSSSFDPSEDWALLYAFHL